MHDVLQQCVQNFKLAPRHISLWDRLWYLRIAKPFWLSKDPTDKLAVHFEHINQLLSDGVVVWAYLIQANSMLFEKGPWDLPGEVVYCIEDTRRADPLKLQQVARKLGQLKGTQPNTPDLSRIAEYLTDELIRVFGLPVPESISPDLKCRISTTYFVRKHLPLRKLCNPLIPFLVHPTNPFVATSLPARYWPPELTKWWTS